jgi:uncharacterized protein
MLALPKYCKKNIQIFEELYIVFRINSFSKNIARSILKEPKIYFFDMGMVKSDDGVKFENLAALILLKYTYGKVDYEGKPYSLNYIRTKDKQEIDFCIVNNNVLEKVIEVKNYNNEVPKFLKTFHERYNIDAILLVHNLKIEKKVNSIQIRRGVDFLRELEF